MRQIEENAEKIQSEVTDLTGRIDSAVPSTSSNIQKDRNDVSNASNINTVNDNNAITVNRVTNSIQQESSSIQNTVSNTNVNTVPFHAISGTQNFTLSEMMVPKFGDLPHDNPIKYLNEMEQFFKMRAVSSKLQMSVIHHSLYSDPAIWFDIQISPESDYETFKNLFISHYWDKSKQSAIRYEVLNGKFDAKKNKSMVEYFIRIGQQAKFLEPSIPMDEFIMAIANHFAPEIRSAIIISRPQTVSEMMNLLKELQPNATRQFSFTDSRRDERQAAKKTENDFLKGGARAAINEGRNLKDNVANNQQSRTVDPRNSGWQYDRNRSSPQDRRGGNKWPQHRNYRNDQGINFLNFDWNQNYNNGNWNNNNNPRWFGRRQYPNNYWQPRNHFQWYDPYRNNWRPRYKRKNNNNNRSQSVGGTHENNVGPSNENIGSLMREQDDRRDAQDPTSTTTTAGNQTLHEYAE